MIIIMNAIFNLFFKSNASPPNKIVLTIYKENHPLNQSCIVQLADKHTIEKDGYDTTILIHKKGKRNGTELDCS